jgi:hypothetical protein
MGRVLEGIDLFHLEFEIGVDELVAEDAALFEEGAVLVEILQRLAKAAADLRTFLSSSGGKA